MLKVIWCWGLFFNLTLMQLESNAASGIGTEKIQFQPHTDAIRMNLKSAAMG
jgi:hypothetical protein